MSFMGYMSSPVSIPPVFDTTPCLDHLMEYEDCVIDAGSPRREFFMPSWPILWPRLADGDTNMEVDTRMKQPRFKDGYDHDYESNIRALTEKQKQLLYECEEERVVVKACMRQLSKLRRLDKHTSWDTAEASNMAYN